MLDITIKTPEDATVANVKDLRDELVSALKGTGRGARVVLDLSDTRQADSSFAQLIAAFKLEATSEGIEVSVVGMGDATSSMAMLACDKFQEDCALGSRKNPTKAGGEA
ncbi:MAG TPA: STAS domain-containing protein [Spirochaetia bacterium]|nr:STAS domain-containing protein [Spirochaetales bacterium]HRW23221.1 STAS domain-containing protein [Spirochaetia bacterium]